MINYYASAFEQMLEQLSGYKRKKHKSAKIKWRYFL